MKQQQRNNNGKTRHYINTIAALICISMLSGCAVMSKPDSCDIEPACELSSPLDNSAAQRLSKGEEVYVEICGCRPWNSTGITVENGDVYAFEVKEVIDWEDGKVPSDPVTGWQGRFNNLLGSLVAFLKRSDESNWYALVGSVTKNDAESFAIQSGGAAGVTMPNSGTLYIYANDKYGRYFNNRGRVKLRVTRVE